MRNIFFLAIVMLFVCSCNNATNSTTKNDKDTTRKDTTMKDTSNPNAPAATNAQY